MKQTAHLKLHWIDTDCILSLSLSDSSTLQH